MCPINKVKELPPSLTASTHLSSPPAMEMMEHKKRPCQTERLLYFSSVIRPPAGASCPPSWCHRRGAWAWAT